ncbi:MAG: AI-2E family transporter [Akkermansiaceae bacterium]|nr:AI-2E family transporter [Akkermansiaceae bacterium]NNM31400.1 AI-2E family transporter [Akkermansiaceae bacterium]
MPRFLRQEQGLKILLILASLVIFIAGLKAGQGFFVPVLLAFFIATVSFPITYWLRVHKVPRLLAVLITVLVDFLFLAGIVVAAVALMGDLQEKWTFEYQPRSVQFIQDVEQSAVAKLKEWKVEDAQQKVRAYLTGDLLTQISEIRVAQHILRGGADVVGRVASFVGTAFIVLILTVFMLTEARMYGRRLNAIAEARGPNLQRVLSATKDIQRYLGIKTSVSLCTGVLAGCLCGVARLDFYLLWGIVAFTLNYIPVVGSIIAGVPPTIMALLLYGWPHATAVAIGYIAINIFLGNFVEPMLMGNRFGLSTLVVLISVLFWGWVWGPVGMLLAVPLMMLLKVVLDNSYEFRWLSVAISKEQRRDGDDEKRIKEAVESAESVKMPEGAATEGGASS